MFVLLKCSKTARKRDAKLFFDWILIIKIGIYSSAATLKVVMQRL